MSWPDKRKILRITALLLFLPLIFLLWLIGTESGLNFIYRYAIEYVPGKITIGNLEGRFVGPINASQVLYENNGTLIKVDKLTLEWRPATLLSNSLDISELQVQSLMIKLPAEEENKNNQPFTLPVVTLPWRVALDNILINDFSIYQNNQSDAYFELKQVKLNASTLLNQVNIKLLTLKAEQTEFRIKGKLNPARNYKHNFKLDWSSQLPNNTTLEGKGDIKGDINKIFIQQQLSGPLQLKFKADIKDLFNQLNWQAEADIIDINPAKIWPEWNGKFTGRLSSQGHTEDNKLIAHLKVNQLTGTLRGFPVNLKSRLDIKNNLFKLNNFDLSSGKTKFAAHGSIKSNTNSSLDFNWSLDSNNLAELYPDALGNIKARGTISGSLDSPQLNTTINGQALALDDYKIAALNGEANIDLLHWKQININLEAQTLKINNFELQSLSLTADNNKLKIKGNTGKATAILELKGQINEQGIQASVEKAELSSNQFSDWKLKTPVNLNMSNDQFSLQPLCLHSTNGKFCTTLQKSNGVWKSQLEANQLPLFFFKSWLPFDMNINGLTDATAEVQFEAPNKLYGQAHIKLQSGDISYRINDDESESLKYQGGDIVLMLNQQGLDVNTEISISNEEFFKGHLTLPAANLLALDKNKQPLKASALLNFQNLGLIEAFIPEIDNLKGKATLNFELSGTLAKPRVTGKADLTNASLRIPRLGLNIEQISLSSRNDGFEKLNFELAARSGGGDLSINGQMQLDSNAGWPTTINIKGTKFEVSHIPVSQLIVSPDLQVKLQKHKIEISGKIDIPYAKLQPKDITTAVQTSNDTVIVGDKQPIEKKWQIHTKVRLSLGERVHFYGFGFEGRFGGSLLLEDEPGQLTKASGEINIPEGRYSAYGQQLLVEHGQLLYTGGPVTNPGLDLRAVRKIGTITAGLKVRGSLNQPQVELFSNPAMGQTDTLAYLLLGRPIENATGNEGEMMAKAALALSLIGGDSLARSLAERFGIDEMRVESSNNGDQASLVIGRYLTPRLYIGYGVGLIESFNTFNVRYKISDHWQLKAESGENQGADLLYTIDR